jgi:MoxR-like ATPase
VPVSDSSLHPSRLDVPAGSELHLPSSGAFPGAVHVWDDDARLAVNMALGAGRPLLLRGEPGSGMSQLARAVAVALGRVFLARTVDSRTEARDLFYTFDTIARLAEAQVQAAIQGPSSEEREKEVRERIAEERFIRPELLWWAFDERSAREQAELARTAPPFAADDPRAPRGAVVLLDEIDKADPSVPNGLLEALGSGTYPRLGSGEPISLRSSLTPPPLIVFTTNEERALPDAFLRRTIVLRIDLPRGDEELSKFLVARGQAHARHAGLFRHAPSEDLLREAARQIADDRRAIASRGLAPPGQAEYLDLIRAVTDVHADEADQLALLAKIARFVCRKHPDAEAGR